MRHDREYTYYSNRLQRFIHDILYTKPCTEWYKSWAEKYMNSNWAARLVTRKGIVKWR